MSGKAMAQLVAVPDSFDVPFAQQLVVEAPGVLDNDLYDGEPAVVVASIEALEDLFDDHPDPEIRARVATLRETLKDSADEVLVAYVGSFAVYQGVDMMFEAIVHAAAGAPLARFVIIGGTPDEIAARQIWLAARGVAARVQFLGGCDPDALPSYLAACDVLLSPRQAGVNTPLKILDYFKAGGAIVATDIQANRLRVDAGPSPRPFR